MNKWLRLFSYACCIYLALHHENGANTGTIKYLIREKKNTEYSKIIVDEQELLVNIDLMTI